MKIMMPLKRNINTMIDKSLVRAASSKDPKPTKPGLQEIFDEFFGTYPFNEQQKPTPRPDWYDEEDTKILINKAFNVAMADDDKDFFLKYLTPYYPKNELEGKSIKELNEMLQILIDRKILNKGGKI